MAIIDVDNIRYKPKADGAIAIAWKFPRDDVSEWAKLIVGESQEAIFLKDGKIVGEPLVPQEGGHVLSTDNFPWLRGIVGRAFGGQTRTPAEVWIVNTTEIMGLGWGTPEPLPTKRRVAKSPVPITVHVAAYGTWSMQVIESQKFLTKIVINKTLSEDYFDAESVRSDFWGTIQKQLSHNLSNLINDENIPLEKLPEHGIDLGESIKSGISPEFQRNGIKIKSFNVETIKIPEGDKARLKEHEDDAAKFTDRYKYDTEAGIAREQAANQSSGLVRALEGGFGIGIGMGDQKAAGLSEQQVGNVESATQNEPEAKLQKLKNLLDQELITEEDFNEQKKRILDSL